MPHAATLFAAALGLAAVTALLLLAWTRLDVPSLRDVPAAPARPERVSIIVAARDEGPHVGAAVRALLAQDYPDFDVVAVDDRSTDDTGAVLDAIAARDSRLRVVHVHELPDGWLGKNHALHVGTAHGDGAWLLFTDGDVVLAPDALARAVRLAQASGADHLALAVDVRCPTWLLALVVNYFMMWFLLALRAWRIRARRSGAHVGIGAFNLVRASAYRAVGGHGRIAMRPDDDLMLGKLLKQSGAAQLLATAHGAAAVTWYHSFGELRRGLRKNSFAGARYSVLLVLLAFVGTMLLAVWPFAAVWLATGAARGWYAAAIAAQLVAYAAAAVEQRNRPWLAPLYPLAALLLMYVFVAAVVRTLARGGIEWRGTFYPLRRLRANRV